MDNFPQQQNNNQPNQSGQSFGEGQGLGVPTPQQSGGAFSGLPKVDVRTMVSDAASIQESGGGGPKPYAPPMDDNKNVPAPSIQAPVPAPVAPTPSPVSTTPASYTPPPFPGGSSMSPGGGIGLGGAPVVSEMTVLSAEPPKGMVAGPKEVKKGGGGKGLFALLLSLILVAGIGAAVYFFIVPIFQKPAEVTSLPQAEEESLNQQPTDSGSAEIGVPVPEAGLSTTPEMEVVQSTSTEVEVAPVLPFVHKSLLKTTADLTEDITLSDASVSGIRGAISFSTADVPSVKEVVFKGVDSNALSFAKVAVAVAPQIFTEEAIKMFEEDFTLLVYTDQKGSWPVYVVKTPIGVRAADVQPKLQTLEASGEGIKGFYLTDPGTAGQWRSGSVGGVTTRYSTFSQAGAGFNYGRTGQIWVLATSYNAFKEVLNRVTQ